jgi:two-component system, LytTR family, sensor kinase
VTDKLILINMLVKFGVVASLASILARASTFRRLFFAERRRPAQTLALLAFFLAPLTLGVWIRIAVPNFLAADISFETIVLLGLLIGPGWAALSGVVLSIPATLHREYLALPFDVVVGLVAGWLGQFVEREEIWSFTPFIDLSLYRWVRRNLRRPRLDRQFLMLFAIAFGEACRVWLARAFPHRLFALLANPPWLRALVCLCAPITVGIALKVWNALRTEMSLEEQKRLLLEARLDALQRQINPHFLFNTLNSIASLVRSKPELAREMTVKLANILRALLRDHTSYVPLREELKFTDDYLDIEVVRFGPEKLRVEKEIDPATLEVLVPSILLQPLIENSIKHGLEPRIHGGTVTVRSRIAGDKMHIEIADDGIGIGTRPVSELRRSSGAGIGIKNVQERLEVLYGDRAHFEVVSNPGRGTLVSIEIPVALS